MLHHVASEQQQQQQQKNNATLKQNWKQVARRTVGDHNVRTQTGFNE